MSGKYALIIANAEYTDPGLAQLTAPGKDAKEFWRVLNSPDIGAFDDVMLVLNQESATVNERIEHFFSEKKTDDLLLLYFSGHGVRDENGALYLAVKNTNRNRLLSTAVSSSFVRQVMDQSRSKRQVLILDCCNSGAFAQGTKAATGVSIGTASAFGAGYGHIVLTASDSTQYAWEGDKVIGGETENSLFTHFLVKGLEGEADRDGDGRITVDELYDYAYEKVKLATPKQTPSKFSTKQQGEILLRQGMRIEDIKPVPLPSELTDELEDKRPYVREAAVQQLIKLLNGKNLGLARSAREALERIAENDDSRTISRTAVQALEALRQADQAKAQIDEKQEASEAERIATQKAEVQRIVNERNIEAERQEKEKAERFAAQKAEEERSAKAKLEAERLAVQKSEEERIAKAQAEAERKAKEEADRLAAQKAEAVHEKVVSTVITEQVAGETKSRKTLNGWLQIWWARGLIVTIVMAVLGFILVPYYGIATILVFSMVIGAFGFMLYPHKTSYILIAVFGVISYPFLQDLYLGLGLGFILSAILSRILYAMKKIKPQDDQDAIMSSVNKVEQKTKLQPTIAPSNKSPIGALALSLILFGGVGQIYLGQWKKGVAFIVTSVLTVSIGIGALTWLYGAIDAYAIAQKMRAGHSIGEWEFGFSWKGTLIAVPIFFVIIIIAGLALGII